MLVLLVPLLWLGFFVRKEFWRSTRLLKQTTLVSPGRRARSRASLHGTRRLDKKSSFQLSLPFLDVLFSCCFGPFRFLCNSCILGNIRRVVNSVLDLLGKRLREQTFSKREMLKMMFQRICQRITVLRDATSKLWFCLLPPKVRQMLGLDHPLPATLMDTANAAGPYAKVRRSRSSCSKSWYPP